MNIEKEIQKIKKYFKTLPIEEFENVLERNGINEISDTSEYGMEFLERITYERHNNKLNQDGNLTEYNINNKSDLGVA